MKRAFGDALVGKFFCRNGCTTLFPREVREFQNDFKWSEEHPDTREGWAGPYCTHCGEPLRYDEGR
jgi:hypothetical protein